MVDLITAKGKIYSSGYFVEHKPSKSVYVAVVSDSGEEVRKVFSDPEETCRIDYNGKIYENYTVLKEFDEVEEGVWKMRLTYG